MEHQCANSIFSDDAEDIGYVIIDMDIENQKKSMDIVQAIQKLNTSIKTRLLP